MTATTDPMTTAPDLLVVEAMTSYDIYKDVHKGLRLGLFGVVQEAGSLDPADDAARAALVDRVGRVATFLDEHAQHEDDYLVPVIDVHAPELAEVIRTDHPVLDRRVAGLRGLADEVRVASGARARAAVHTLYLELASFTGAYLQHQDFEERHAMRALAAALPVEELVAIDQAIVASIPPDLMAEALGFMLPAMNVDDRVEMLGGMRDGAPPEVFAGVCALAESVLTADAWSATAARLGLV